MNQESLKNQILKRCPRFACCDEDCACTKERVCSVCGGSHSDIDFEDLNCPYCGLKHIDGRDKQGRDWSDHPHQTHLCQGCWKFFKGSKKAVCIGF